MCSVCELANRRGGRHAAPGTCFRCLNARPHQSIGVLSKTATERKGIILADSLLKPARLRNRPNDQRGRRFSCFQVYHRQRTAGFWSRVGYLVGCSSIRDEADNTYAALVDQRLVGSLTLLDTRTKGIQENALIRLDQKAILRSIGLRNFAQHSTIFCFLAVGIVVGPIALKASGHQLIVAPPCVKRRVRCSYRRLLIVANAAGQQRRTTD